jgi:isopenicillin-N N-acyltransferase-like protein
LPSIVSSGDLPEIFAEGDNRELGRQHGHAARDLIHKLLHRRLSHSIQYFSKAKILERAMQYLPYVERYAFELLDEVAGLAEGADITFEEAFFLQVATELEGWSVDGCSGLGDSTCPTGVFIAQNWDQPAEAYGEQIILRLYPRGKPSLVMFTHAGVIGYIGMNSAGVGHVNMQLYASTRPKGLTGYFMTRKLLDFERLSEGLEWLSEVQVGSSGSYMLGDSSGKITDIELGDGTYKAIEAPKLAHTNHYLTDGWQVHDRASELLPDSYARIARLNRIFSAGSGEEAAFAALRDHMGFPQGICRHETGTGTRTLASILMRLERSELLVCYGNPCEGTYVTYPV